MICENCLITLKVSCFSFLFKYSSGRCCDHCGRRCTEGGRDLGKVISSLSDLVLRVWEAQILVSICRWIFAGTEGIFAGTSSTGLCSTPVGFMKDTCQEKVLFDTNNKRSYSVGGRRNGSVNVIYRVWHGKKQQPGSLQCCTKAGFLVSKGLYDLLITHIPSFILPN